MAQAVHYGTGRQSAFVILHGVRLREAHGRQLTIAIIAGFGYYQASIGGEAGQCSDHICYGYIGFHIFFPLRFSMVVL
jgi:hypothetical protein